MNSAVESDLEMALDALLDAQTHTAHFAYEDGKWLLRGETSEGLGWETDDFEAESLEFAQLQAIDYIENLSY